MRHPVRGRRPGRRRRRGARRPLPRRAPPTGNRRPHPPRSSGDRPRRGRGRVPRRARRDDRPHRLRRIADRNGRGTDPAGSPGHRPAVHPRRAVARRRPRLLALAEAGCRRIVVVGGGYIGLEMAEAYIERGCTATVVDAFTAAARRHRCTISAAAVADAMRVPASTCSASVAVVGFEPGAVADVGRPARGRPRRARHRRRAAVRARRGRRHRARRQDAIRVDDRQATSAPPCGRPGDCATSTHLVTGGPVAHRRSAPTPTSTVGSPGSTWPAATHERPRARDGDHQAVQAGDRPRPALDARPSHSTPASTPSPRRSTRRPSPATSPTPRR